MKQAPILNSIRKWKFPDFLFSILYFQLICLVLCLSACGDKEENSAAPPEEVPGGMRLADTSGKQIDILAWLGLNTWAEVSWYKDLADAGFTLNLSSDLAAVFQADRVKADATIVHTVLSSCANNKLKSIISWQVLDILDAASIERMKKHPGFAGWFIKDEPHQASSLPAVKAAIDRVKAIDSDHFCYVNEVAVHYTDSWAPETSGEGPEPTPARIYYEKFFDIIKPAFFSFDAYPLYLEDNLENPNRRGIYEFWYYTLELVSELCKKHDVPFWAFALCSPYNDDGVRRSPVVTLSDLRLQVYSNLAYGAQCIQYFAYVANQSMMEGKYLTAPIEWVNVAPWWRAKTPAYYTVKEMNREIIALSPVFLNARMIWAGHTGNIPEKCKALDETKLPPVITSLDITGGDGAIVSLMEKGEENFLVIVNRDPNEDMSVQVSGTDDLYRVQKDASIVEAESASLTVTPGDCLIYYWKTKS
jgi:hypothetical protein